MSGIEGIRVQQIMKIWQGGKPIGDNLQGKGPPAWTEVKVSSQEQEVVTSEGNGKSEKDNVQRQRKVSKNFI
jgi:hypothetical protein